MPTDAILTALETAWVVFTLGTGNVLVGAWVLFFPGLLVAKRLSGEFEDKTEDTKDAN